MDEIDSRVGDDRGWAAVIALAELEALVGHRFPGGTYRVEPYRDWLVRDAVLAEPAAGDVVHPMFCYYGALAGMGISLDELFALAGATADSGVMFGEARIDLRRPLVVGEQLTVRGGITGVQRKEGRKAGVFDILAFELELVGGSEDVAAVSTNSFVFPRRDP